MKYTHLYTGTDGESHFEDVELALSSYRQSDYRSESLKATGVFFVVNDSSHHVDWHCAPRRQFVITLEGAVEIEASDGTKRRFGPGDIMLADDKTGRGHITRVVDPRGRRAVFIPLE
jgi:hypothetical protein